MVNLLFLVMSVFCLFFSIPAASKPQIQPPQQTQLEIQNKQRLNAATVLSHIESQRIVHKIPGMTVGIWRDGKSIIQSGLGISDIENQVDAEVNTLYRVASVTKPLSATLMMGLKENDMLTLEEKVKFPGYWKLCNRAFKAPIASVAGYQCKKNKLSVRSHLTHTTQSPSGDVFSYSGGIYGFLTQMIEHKTDDTYVNMFIKHILQPAGMSQSMMGQDNLSKTSKDKLAIPYLILPDGIPLKNEYPDRVEKTSAGLVATVPDLGKFAASYLSGKLINGKSRAEMEDLDEYKTRDGGKLLYGLGWFGTYIDNVKVLYHPGWWPSAFSSLLIVVPEHNSYAVFLANSGGLTGGNYQGITTTKSTLTQNPFAAIALNTILDIDLPVTANVNSYDYQKVTINKSISSYIPSYWQSLKNGHYLSEEQRLTVSFEEYDSQNIETILSKHGQVVKQIYSGKFGMLNWRITQLSDKQGLTKVVCLAKGGSGAIAIIFESELPFKEMNHTILEAIVSSTSIES